MISNKKVFHQNSNAFSGRKHVISKKNKSTRHSPQLSASFLTMSGNKQLIVQIRLFLNQNALWPLAKCSVAHRWAMAHRLKTTDLPQLEYYFSLFFLFSYFFFIILLRLSTFKPLNALYSKFERLKISGRTSARLKLGVPDWGITLKRVLQNFKLLNR